MKRDQCFCCCLYRIVFVMMSLRMLCIVCSGAVFFSVLLAPVLNVAGKMALFCAWYSFEVTLSLNVCMWIGSVLSLSMFLSALHASSVCSVMSTGVCDVVPCCCLRTRGMWI